MSQMMPEEVTSVDYSKAGKSRARTCSMGYISYMSLLLPLPWQSSSFKSLLPPFQVLAAVKQLIFQFSSDLSQEASPNQLSLAATRLYHSWGSKSLQSLVLLAEAVQVAVQLGVQCFDSLCSSLLYKVCTAHGYHWELVGDACQILRLS